MRMLANKIMLLTMMMVIVLAMKKRCIDCVGILRVGIIVGIFKATLVGSCKFSVRFSGMSKPLQMDSRAMSS